MLGWGVGGIEAEAAMLGQPVSMLIPRVVGFKLTGEIPTGATATDVVLTITEMLRKHGVVGKFVEFYGEGVAAVPLANRATIGNMSPEFGSTAAIFPIDDVTVEYLRLTGRCDQQVALVEAYAKEQGLWHDASTEAKYSEYIELDLSTVVPSIAGPKRPQDRVSLSAAKEGFREVLPDYAEGGHVAPSNGGSFPASDPSAPGSDNEDGGSAPEHSGGGGRASNPVTVSLDGQEVEIDHGSVVIASITSCTNTSNPSVMVGAGLLAKKAVEKGLQRKPWVKTSLAPGSKVVTNYYDKSGLTPYLEKLGYHLVGYGCTTCIGNSGPIIDEVSAAVQQNDLAVVSVLSGNRNFEGRINPDVKMNYLASPPLVIAYALAGTMDFDFESDPLGQDTDGHDVFLRDIWPTPAEVEQTIAGAISQDMFTDDYADVFAGDERWQSLPTPEGATFAWDPESTYVRKPPYFDGMAKEPSPVEDISGAKVLLRLGDSVTTDHISPAGAIKADSPAGRYLAEHGVERKDFNSYGSRRGNHEVMIRGTFAEHPAAQPAARRRGGRLHPRLHEGRRAVQRLRRRAELRRGRHPAGDPVRQGVRLRLQPRLGREGHGAARRQGRHRRVVRADPPLQPDRHGRAAAAVPAGRERRVARARRHRDLRHQRRHRAERGPDAAHGEGRRPPRTTAPPSRSTPWCGSTPPARPTTTATAASCSTCSVARRLTPPVRHEEAPTGQGPVGPLSARGRLSGAQPFSAPSAVLMICRWKMKNSTATGIVISSAAPSFSGNCCA